MKKSFPVIICILLVLSGQAQNVGIGTTTPAHKLDVAGRLRIQHSAAGTAGIWLDGPTIPQRSFIGTFNDNHVGIWGGAGASWSFVMNVEDGYIGIGTQAPTARLDVNGSLRIRQNGATAGSSLHAVDALGNTEWFAPIAFNVKGYSAGANITFPGLSWRDINFGSNIEYNFGSGYNSTTSEFVAPQTGLYQFKSQLHFSANCALVSQRLRLRRNGVVSTITHTENQPGSEVGMATFTSLMDIDVMLQAGDAVWIEAYGQHVSNLSINITGNGLYTWFSGRMLIPL